MAEEPSEERRPPSSANTELPSTSGSSAPSAGLSLSSLNMNQPTSKTKPKEKYQFWSTQPVLQFSKDPEPVRFLSKDEPSEYCCSALLMSAS